VLISNSHINLNIFLRMYPMNDGAPLLFIEQNSSAKMNGK